MMMLEDIRDYIASLDVAEHVYMGKLPDSALRPHCPQEQIQLISLRKTVPVRQQPLPELSSMTRTRRRSQPQV